jgi:hypothetical protein
MNPNVKTVALWVGGLALLGCNQLLSQATGGRLVSRANVKIINDSPRKICAVKVKTADGNVVGDNALASGGIGVEPGQEGVAQVDEKLGKVSLEAYSCEPQPLLLAEQTVDMANPTPMRVR